MANRKYQRGAILALVILGIGLCALIWLKLSAQWASTDGSAQATRDRESTLTTRYGEKLATLVEIYERGRWETSEISDVKTSVTSHYVLEYTATRCQVYAAVAIESQHLHNDLDSRACGFCALYVFVRPDPEQSWQFGTFLPIMWSADDLARDWRLHKELGTYTGFIDTRPRWEPCPYWICTRSP